MPSPLVRAIRDKTPPTPQMVPCTVTQLTPLLITLNGTANLPAVLIPGAFYSLGPAIALWQPPGVPLVIPIG